MTDSTKIERHPWEVKIDARVFHDAIEITQQGPFDTTREVIRMRESVKQKAVSEWLLKNGWTSLQTVDRAKSEAANLAILVALQVIRMHDQPVIAREIVEADLGIENLIDALDAHESVDVDTLKWLCHNEYRKYLPKLRSRINKLRREHLNKEREQ